MPDCSSNNNMIRLLTFNLRQGGGKRIDRIADMILSHRPDVTVLTEYRVTTGPALGARLALGGLTHQASSEPERAKNGVLIASRLPFRSVANAGSPSPSPQHWIEAEFKYFRLGAIYNAVHQDGVEAFRGWLCDLMVARRSRSFILMGDLNWLEMGDGGNEQPGAVEWLRDLGYTDAWRKLNPGAREYSWTNHNGTRTRVDYAFLSRRISGRLVGAQYVHVERESELSDHCPLIVDLAEPDLISRVTGLVWRREPRSALLGRETEGVGK